MGTRIGLPALHSIGAERYSLLSNDAVFQH